MEKLTRSLTLALPLTRATLADIIECYRVLEQQYGQITVKTRTHLLTEGIEELSKVEQDQITYLLIEGEVRKDNSRVSLSLRFSQRSMEIYTSDASDLISLGMIQQLKSILCRRYNFFKLHWSRHSSMDCFVVCILFDFIWALL